MKYYKAKLYSWSPEILEVDVEKETKSSVFIDGRREPKKTNYYAYFKTYNEAFDYFIKLLTNNIANKEKALEEAKNDFENFHDKYKRQ
jgi:hypothetical protein